MLRPASRASAVKTAGSSARATALRSLAKRSRRSRAWYFFMERRTAAARPARRSAGGSGLRPGFLRVCGFGQTAGFALAYGLLRWFGMRQDLACCGGGSRSRDSPSFLVRRELRAFIAVAGTARGAPAAWVLPAGILALFSF